MIRKSKFVKAKSLELKFIFKISGYLILFCFVQNVLAQTENEKAAGIAHQASQAESEGKFEEAVSGFEKAKELDPDNKEYAFQIAYCDLQLKKYEKVISIAEKLIAEKTPEEKVFELLAKAYLLNGKDDQARATYEAGLKNFPTSGNLYMDLGLFEKDKKEYDKAIGCFEKGIENDPKNVSNYYWASKLYCSTTEKVWGMIYGEIFINIERKGERAEEISKLLYDTYKSQIRFNPDSSVLILFSKEEATSIEQNSFPDNNKLLYGKIYGFTLLKAVAGEKEIDINSLDRIRTRFLEEYFKMGYNIMYPNILFNYQHDLLQQDDLEAYNHWLLRKGDEEAYNQWLQSNKLKWNAFTVWFTYHRLKPDAKHKFFSGQY